MDRWMAGCIPEGSQYPAFEVAVGTWTLLDMQTDARAYMYIWTQHALRGTCYPSSRQQPGHVCSRTSFNAKCPKHEGISTCSTVGFIFGIILIIPLHIFGFGVDQVFLV